MTAEFGSGHFSAGLLAAALALIALLWPSTARLAGAQDNVDRIVASVDGEPITTRDLTAFIAANGATLPPPGDPRRDELEHAALKGMIEQRMMEAELKNYEAEIDDRQVDNYIERVREKSHLGEQEFREQVMHSGLTWDQFRKQAKVELEKMNMIDKQVRARIEISQVQIQAYYDGHKDQFTVAKERLKLAQILVAVQPNAPPAEIDAARKKAQDLRKRAAGGEDFAVLAAKYSDDDSKSKNGELGDFAPDDMLDEIKAAVINVKPGQVSEVVQTKYGFHIVKVEEHDKPGLRPLPEVTDDIRDELTAASTQDRFKKWLDEDLIKSHHVESFL